MTTKKSCKFLSVLLVLCMLLSMLPVGAMAKDVHQSGCNYAKDKTCECDARFRELWDGIMETIPTGTLEADAADDDEMVDWCRRQWLKNFIKTNEDAFEELGVNTNKQIKVRVKCGDDGDGTMKLYYKDEVLESIDVTRIWARSDNDEDVTIKLQWVGVKKADQPKKMTALLYRNGREVKEHSIRKSSNWRYKWDNLRKDDSNIWMVGLEDLPEGCTYSVDRVKGNYFKVTVTKES